MSDQSNAPAFPGTSLGCFNPPGLTKREHFAALAMQGYCAVEAGWHQPAAQVARCAVAMADALLAALGSEG